MIAVSAGVLNNTEIKTCCHYPLRFHIVDLGVGRCHRVLARSLSLSFTQLHSLSLPTRQKQHLLGQVLALW